MIFLVSCAEKHPQNFYYLQEDNCISYDSNVIYLKSGNQLKSIGTGIVSDRDYEIYDQVFVYNVLGEISCYGLTVDGKLDYCCRTNYSKVVAKDVDNTFDITIHTDDDEDYITITSSIELSNLSLAGGIREGNYKTVDNNSVIKYKINEYYKNIEILEDSTLFIYIIEKPKNKKDNILILEYSKYHIPLEI